MYEFEKKPEIKNGRKKTKKEVPVYYNTTQLYKTDKHATITIGDGVYNDVEGKSGDGTDTLNKMVKYKELYRTFRKKVTCEKTPDRYGELYDRFWYNCAEPNALSNLVDKYSNPTEDLDLEKVRFPHKAKLEGTETEIDPCVVCSKWVETQDTNLPLKSSFIQSVEDKIKIKKEEEKDMKEGWSIK